jgi:pilus assembly protein TadC
MLPVVVIGGSTGVILGAIAAAFGLALTGNAAPPIPLVAADVVSVPLVLDLVVTALRSGLPVDAALAEGAAAAASSQVRDELLRISGLLRLGSSPESAWSRFAADPRLRAVAVVATRSANSGIRLADGWSATAHQLRLDAAAAAMSRAGRVGTWSMAPLGLCFLPAFICLGIAPVVIGLASGMLNGDLL